MDVIPLSCDLALTPARGLLTLEADWLSLEARADASAFTSWGMVGVWLESLPASCVPWVLSARLEGLLVGLAIVVEGTGRAFRHLPVRSWYLHSTGNPASEGLASEYNGFLIDRRCGPELAGAMLEFLLREHAPRRLEIQAATGPLAALAQRPPDGLMADSRERLSYMVSLDAVRAHPEGHLGLLSRNARSQVRRSLRAYVGLGELHIEAATSVDMAHAWMARLRELHAAHWDGKGVNSHFAHSPVARALHARLIDSAFGSGLIQLLRVKAGPHELGYLYNLVYRGRAAYYQSGFRFGLVDRDDRPGLVAHTLAVAHNAALGLRWYDFMAGDYRYKQSLSTDTEVQHHCRFRRRDLPARVEQLVRRGQVRTTTLLMQPQVMAMKDEFIVPLAAQVLQTFGQL